MRMKHVIMVIFTVVICLFLFSLPGSSTSALSADPLPTQQVSPQTQDQVKIAILKAIGSNDRYIQKGLVPSIQVTDVQTSLDQKEATAWVLYYDPVIDAVLPLEPGLTIASYIDGQWKVYLPSNPDWQTKIDQAPEELLTQSQKDMWLAMDQGKVETFPTQSGYLLPWHGGLTGYLSRSVGHDADYSTSHFAFDFYFPGNTVCPGSIGLNAGTEGANFSISAAKAGTVWGWDDSVEDCDHSNVNFIVLRNSDDPSIFQLYMHLSQGSIPPALKVVGAPVARGQFIALADNTGNSTGSHVHFQVEHQPYWPTNNPYWNTSLDVTFGDVDINGGRPRVSPLDPPFCLVTDICDVFRSTYVSSNYYLGDSTPPTGGLSGVTNGAVVNTQTLNLSGWGADAQSGFDYGQLIALFTGSWHNLGAPFNPSFSYTWDFCDTQMVVPNGPVSVALRLYDVAGNSAPLVGLSSFTKTYTCPLPPPSCVPNSNQVTLFEDPYYAGGCVKFSVGNYPTGSSLNPLGNDDAESIMVGSNVIATLFSDENYSGHSQAFLSDTAYMQYQWVASNTTSSMKVTLRSTVPQAPILVSPVPASIFRQGDVVPLSWRNGGNATEYQVEIYLNSNLYQSLPWQAAPVGYVASLPLGGYTWRVHARNTAEVSVWSQQSAFSVESPIVIPNAETVPYSDTMESTQSKWVPSSSGFWSYKNDITKAHSGTHSWWYQSTVGDYDNDAPNNGSLTSPPISIPNIEYYLHFYYRVQTETQGTTWDQRWVQISVDGGPFTNLLQLYDDPQIPETVSWMRSKAIDLSSYAGHSVRIRFQFTTFDSSANNYPGWGIDDFSITSTPPPTCGENRQDETPAQAFLLTYDPAITIPGEICPNGDYDYYKFYGTAGDHIVADVDAMVNGSPLDSYLYLLDTDGQTVLAENDDEVYGERRDPLLSYKLPATGYYYLKLKAWKHPLVGGSDNFYTIRLYSDDVKPQATITWPAPGTYLPDSLMTITAQVSDVINGVNRIEFYWHPTDWLVGGWEKLGTDWDGSDGWSMQFNPAGEPEGKIAAFFIQVYDMAGNWTGVPAWNIGIDKTPPNTAMIPLEPVQSSNAVLLSWTGSDNLSGIDYFNIQESVNGGAWTALPSIDGTRSNYWDVGNPGNSYAYRMRGVDHSGNTENYPSTAEVSTTIPQANVLCYSLDPYDSGGNDNSPANASLIYLDGAGQFHNFCNPLIPGYQNDEDWVKLVPIPGHRYLFISVASSQPSAMQISLFAQDGTTLLGQSAPSAFGNNTTLSWLAGSDQPVYIRLRHVDERVIGSEVGGTFYAKTGWLSFLPVLNR
jgi:hypothetical protein